MRNRLMMRTGINEPFSRGVMVAALVLFMFDFKGVALVVLWFSGLPV